MVACAHGNTSRPGSDDDSAEDAGAGPSRDSGVDAGVDSGVDDEPITSTLSIAAAASDLVITNGVPAHTTFTATLTAIDGTTRDVTTQSLFTINVKSELGGFAGNVLTIGVAARAQVTAVHRNKIASANITARVKSVRVDASLSPDTPNLFAGPETATTTPLIVYPAPDAVAPRNLGGFEIHWTDSHANDVFELSLKTELSDVRIYVLGEPGDPAFTPIGRWSTFLPREWQDAVGLQTAVTYQVRGAHRAGPSGIDATPPRMVQLPVEDMDGALYYWVAKAANNVIGIFRHDMRQPEQAAPEPFLITPTNPDGTPKGCITCHVLSRSGKKMSVTYDKIDGGFGAFVDVATKAPGPKQNAWSFGTFTPDDTQFLAVEHGVLQVRDTTTQVVLATMTTMTTIPPGSNWVTEPDLSPDGTQLVYVRPVLSGTDASFKQGQIIVRSYTAATRAFGPERILVDGTQSNNFYPSWSPDGVWIAFNRAPVDVDSYNDNNTSAWVIKADRSQPAIELKNANQGPGLTNSWVRWAPFAQTLGASKEPMFWLTLSSKRDFGVRLKNSGVALSLQTAQLWMTPFFPARAAAGADPSVPAIRLPWQELTSSTHIAQWTERVVVSN
jgi:hypothetical protein